MALIRPRSILLFILLIILTAAKNVPEVGETQKQSKKPSSTVAAPVSENPSDAKKENSDNSRCVCGLFNTQKPKENDDPIIYQFVMNVTCDESGEENCAKLCKALAEAAKERAPQVLCSALGHFNNLKASIHSNICGSKKWVFTGLTSPDEICCHESLPTECNEKSAD
ncbi:hypothetical protein FQR65_LT18180 [Abscondita terminalis]|nr:hypothetical protein FQR65_LT18180 [Abscondita terminalis]